MGKITDGLHQCPVCSSFLQKGKTESKDCTACKKKAETKKRKEAERKKQEKIDAIKQLWEMGIVTDWLLRDYQIEVRDHITNTESTDIIPIVLSRQSGKCQAKGTLVTTKTGVKKIEDIQIGDIVYGYNEDGTVSETEVKQVHHMGKKEVVDLVNNNQVLGTTTLDHRFLFNTKSKGGNKILKLKDSKAHHTIVQEWVYPEMGEVFEERAYGLGAMLGDGCCRQNAGTYKLYISSADESVVKKTTKSLGLKVYYKNHETNYTWTLGYEEKHVKRSTLTKLQQCEIYDEWCKNKYAHEKIINIETLKTWNRESCLEFLAGLIDTDGSVYCKNNILIIKFDSQSKSIIDSMDYLIKSMYQINTTIMVDDRDKYVNGPCYTIQIANNFHSKRILKELSSHLVCKRKQWKQEYEALPEYNIKGSQIGVKFCNKRIEETYDLGIDNDTHMYVTHNGLVTHNSYSMCAIADELCRQNQNYRITFVAPVQNQARMIAKFTMREVLETCPPELHPTFKTQDNMYIYPNGSVFEILGNNAGRIEKARGGKSHLIILDEVGFFDDLEYSVRSVLYPRLTTTNGKIVMISTPPRSAGHPFADFVSKAKYNNALLVKNIFDCGHFTAEEINKIAEEYGGYDSIDFRREYGCEFITDIDLAVIPEAIEAEEFDKNFVKEFKRPPFYDTYVGMDLGFNDPTGLLFGVFDFRTTKLYIEDEILIRDAQNLRTDKIAEFITTKESELWCSVYDDEIHQPYKRISDIDPLTLNDLYLQHNLYFQATTKDTLQSMVNELRLWFSQDKIVIHPRCHDLIFQIKNATFKDKNKKTFSRSKKAGHYDLLAALMYLVRNIDKSHNPYPRDYDLRLESINEPFVSPKWSANNGNYKDELAKAFGLKRKRKK